MYQAYEKEGLAEKKQLVALHQQHVQGMFNKKKRELMEQLASELEEDEPRVSRRFRCCLNLPDYSRTTFRTTEICSRQG